MSFSDHRPEKNRPNLELAEAKRKIMDLMAVRDHSEKELRKKMSTRCEPEVLDQAMAWAEQQSWFGQPEAIKENLVEQLTRKGKGRHQINQKLEELGLDLIQIDPETEYEKAKKVVSTKWSSEDFRDLSNQDSQKMKTKVARFLISRGFDIDIVSKILKEELKAGDLSHDEEY